jgi:hypothetical protein
MNEDYIPENELIPGVIYECVARNFQFGYWTGKAFVYVRTKFGATFLDKEYHWDKGINEVFHLGTVKPLGICRDPLHGQVITLMKTLAKEKAVTK